LLIPAIWAILLKDSITFSLLSMLFMFDPMNYIFIPILCKFMAELYQNFTFGSFGSSTLKIKLSSIFIVFSESILCLFHVILRLLHRFLRLSGESLGVDLHIDQGIFKGWLRFLRFVSHCKILYQDYLYTYINHILSLYY
jgi:hypothetical protein